MLSSSSKKGDDKAADTDKSYVFAPPAISLPKGGGAIKGMGEKFAANPVTGTGSMSLPLATSSGRSGFCPQLSLAYDSGAGNGIFGLGWNLSLPSITCKTDEGLPHYWDDSESDIFILPGAEDLVPVLIADGSREILDSPDDRFKIQRYRPQIEGLFARIERWTKVGSGEAHWGSISKDNITTLYGKTAESRIADAEQPTHVFSWLICESYDEKCNTIPYEYKAENLAGIFTAQAHEYNPSPEAISVNHYLKRIHYGNRTPRQLNEDLSQQIGYCISNSALSCQQQAGLFDNPEGIAILDNDIWVSNNRGDHLAASLIRSRPTPGQTDRFCNGVALPFFCPGGLASGFEGLWLNDQGFSLTDTTCGANDPASGVV